MEVERTAMQELIEILQAKRDMWKADGKLEERRMRGAYVDAIMMAKTLLDKEHEQLWDMYEEGIRDNEENQ